MNTSFEMFCETNNIRLHLGRLPSGIKGMAFYYGNAYMIIINERCSVEQQGLTTLHELIHILENHFHCDQGDAEKCEKEVDAIIRKLKSSLSLFLDDPTNEY